MALLVAGGIFVVVGIAMAAIRTAERGRLSQADARPDTLEPTGKGRQLSLKADLPGLGMAAFGVLLIFAGALSERAG